VYVESKCTYKGSVLPFSLLPSLFIQPSDIKNRYSQGPRTEQ